MGWTGILAVILDPRDYQCPIFYFPSDQRDTVSDQFAFTLLLLLSVYLFVTKYNSSAVVQLREVGYFVYSKYYPRVPVVGHVEEYRELDTPGLIAAVRKATEHLKLSNDLPLEEVLDGCTIRRGINRKRDYEQLSRRLGSLVTWFPWKGKAWISSSQYRRLIRQIILEIRTDLRHRSTHPRGEQELKFTVKEKVVPMSISQVLLRVLQKWFNFPLNFVYVVIGSLAMASISPLQALFSGNLVASVTAGNQGAALTNLIAWSVVTLAPIGVSNYTSYVASRLNTRVAALHRKRILEGILSGGTEFHERHAAGEIVNAFSSQTAKLEYMLTNATYTMLICTFTMILGIVVAANLDPFTAVLFFALLPVMFSIDVLTERATALSKKASKSEGEVSSKFSNVVEAIPVIRACDAGSWVNTRLEEPMAALGELRQRSMYASGIVQNFYIAGGSLYQASIIVPLGISLIYSADRVDTGTFVTLIQLTQGVVSPLKTFGGFLRNATSYSGAIQTIDDLIDDGAAFAEATVVPGNATLSALSSELQVRDLVFRYNGGNVDVLKGVRLTIRRGTYVVMCGGSGR